jgi:hypothetical protein
VPKLVPRSRSRRPGGATVAPCAGGGAAEGGRARLRAYLIRPSCSACSVATTLVFSADETAREVSETLARKAIENDPRREGAYRFLTTGDPVAFRAMGSRFLQLPIADVEHVEVARLESVVAA